MARQLIRTLKKRRHFICAAEHGLCRATPSFILQIASVKWLEGVDSSDLHVGFTASKKVGNAVMRNRVKRRLRAAASDVLPEYGKKQYYYVLIGRRNGAQYPYHQLCQDFKNALHTLHTKAAF